jgi:uncharacterized protein (DUF2267 family)
MSQTGLETFDSTIQTTNIWLNGIMERMKWSDRHRAYSALRAVLHALRDHMTADIAASFAAQLPLLLRGVFYEGWHPAGKPIKERHREAFLEQVRKEFRGYAEGDTAEVVRAVLLEISRHVTAGEIESVKQILPHDIRALWP